MNMKAILKNGRLALLVSLLVLASRHAPPIGGQPLPRPGSSFLSLEGIVDTLANMTHMEAVLAATSELGGGTGNENGDDENENDNDNGDTNDNGSTNDNGGSNDNGDSNDNNDDGGNINENGNENDNENGNENGNGNENENENGNGNENGSGEGDFVADEVVVELRPGADPNQVAQRHDLTIRERLERTNIFRMGIPRGLSVERVLDQLSRDPDVEQGEPNFIIHLPEPQIDPRTFVFIDPRTFVFIDGASPGEYFDQEAVARIRAQEAHQMATGEDITVAVIDTGIDLTHPAFEGRLALEKMFDFVDDPHDTDPTEEGEGPGFGHGTFVAGIIALVAPEAKIMPIRAFDSEGKGTTFDIAQAIRYAATNGALVINMSFGMMNPPPFVVQTAIQIAHKRHAFLVASAGNDGEEFEQYPASDNERVVAVAATDENDQLADFSNFGFHIDVCAPGVGIFSTYPGETPGTARFARWSGTSFAAPFVSGEAALLYSTIPAPLRRRPALFGRPSTVERVFRAIMDSAVDIEPNHPPALQGKLGAGRIDVLGAVIEIER